MPRHLIKLGYVPTPLTAAVSALCCAKLRFIPTEIIYQIKNMRYSRGTFIVGPEGGSRSIFPASYVTKSHSH